MDLVYGGYLVAIVLQVILTERAGHAHDIMAKASEDDLKAQDGVVVVVINLENDLVSQCSLVQPALDWYMTMISKLCIRNRLVFWWGIIVTNTWAPHLICQRPFFYEWDCCWS